MESIIDVGVQKLQEISKQLDGTQDVQEIKKFNKRVVGVYGSQGGAGVSSFIEELAIMFANNKFNVLIIDGSFLFPLHRIYYTEDENQSSLTSVLNAKDNALYSVIKKSLWQPKISYAHQAPVDLQTLVKFEDDFSNYTKMSNAIQEYRKSYDVILIDIKPELLLTGLEQALLKNCEYLLNIKTSEVTSTLFNQDLIDMISLTAKNNVKTQVIENKVEDINKELLYLPYEEYFYETYNSAKSFLVSGKSDSNLYIEQFQIIYEVIIKELYGEE